jgi:membrane-associated phospholipid phosphatase
MITNEPPAPLSPEPPKPSLRVARYWQPIIAFVFLVFLCLWGVKKDHFLDTSGRVLGEGAFSVYNGMLVVAAVMVFLLAKLKRDPSIAWRVWDLTLVCLLTSQILKQLPFTRPSGGGHGFPSGHTLTAFAVAWLLMETYPRVAPFAFMVALAVGWSRVETGAHFTYQVLIGAVMGLVIGYAVTTAKNSVGVLLPRIWDNWNDRQKRRASL